ncbi:head GIN domain-containing protein [Zunongwangia sp. F363]|uniref:Head GIN domain-containing protein n=1 Tax=Autumnicola tepida TaxID=3075595 RepID=A0ABU3CDW9_9FLAO|nr:head GIN domain-containing protein [Zunongwangia sp. F363]MDT0644539.1 head GIN domain-containing protein [Zunongwangia sp. F363]
MKNKFLVAKQSLIALMICVFSFNFSNAQSETVKVYHFSEVTISPYIEAVFKQSNEESVVIENSKVAREKINIEIDGKELHIYLEDARIVGKEKEVHVNGHEVDKPIYKGTEVRITVNYKELDGVEIRSEERIQFKDPIKTVDFALDIYGSPKVYFESITAEEFKVALYGESYLKVKGGKVDFQRYRCYGSSEVNTLDLESDKTKIAAYGSNHVVINVSEELKVSAFGESNIEYKGDARLKNGLKIGETVIHKIH